MDVPSIPQKAKPWPPASPDQHPGQQRDRLIEHLAFRFLTRKTRQLHLHRCGFGPNAQNDLIINGASTFRNVCLDEWEAKPRMSHSSRRPPPEVWLHLGVSIAVDTTHGSWNRFTAESKSLSSMMSETNKASLSGHFAAMENTDMHGARDHDDGGWWKNWRGPRRWGRAAAAVYAGAVHAMAAGASVNFAWGALSVKAGAGMAAVTGDVTTAGTAVACVGGAVLLGAGVAAAVYFVLWGYVFGMLKRALSWF
ncbi:uncharacterized protein C8A04DRAFT_33424 [Dichotomopilus funicola]|uniref:Uncharacterized protein n=1 Tax=Dichotomopilus funicola TaxID=1934379 RepID=A0AAN6UTV7_9PEZI|nr:hypothetical protein C8A04DRAFT_33424 [Dichotomopilus funicola]